MMDDGQHYLSPAGMVYYLSADDHINAVAHNVAVPRADWTPITADQARAITNPPPSQDRLWAGLRAERDARLAASDVMVLPDRWDTYSGDQRAAWTAYRQALRDLPETTADPAAPIWPVPPSV